MPAFAPFTVAVPATTANLGPGFDCLGMALDLWNTVRVSPSASLEIVATGEGRELLPSDNRNLVYRAASRLFQAAGRPMPPLRLEACNVIPLSRGLGSSAAAVVAGLTIANRLAGGPLDTDALLALATDIEGHPDNAAPALLGGCCLVVQSEKARIVRPVTFPHDLACVLFIPNMALSTKKARGVLPRRVPHADAIFNVGRAALLVHALAAGDWPDLRLATEDRLHQPYRAALFPEMEPLLKAALDAGAAGAFLSGAGSTLLAFARAQNAPAVAQGFESAAKSRGVAGRVQTVQPTHRGAHVLLESVH